MFLNPADTRFFSSKALPELGGKKDDNSVAQDVAGMEVAGEYRVTALVSNS